ncbi:PAS domain S-box protein [Candidatus Parcubacteria bacterium]|nr:PAS domain S-box protein [Candidatus Parcubacteria bacterium]
MDFSYKRKLEVNEWIITTRWFYMVAVFLIGIVSNTLISVFEVKFTFFSICFLLLVYLFINAYLYRVLTAIKKHQSEIRLKILSVGQIIIELVIFTIVMRLVGEESIASVFFFLPIISAAMIFGIKGAVITALASAILVNISVVAGYMDILIQYVFNRDIFNAAELVELRYITFSLISVIVTSNFYIVLAFVSGYSFKLVFKREQRLMSLSEQLTLEKQTDEKEVKRLDANARKLAEQDRKLKTINIELSKRLNQLENSEKSIIRAFADLQEARKKTDDERNKTAAIISNFIDPIIVIDVDNKINLINPSAMEIFGFTADDLGKEVSPKNNYSFENFKELIQEDFSIKTSKELKSNNPNEEELVITVAEQEFTYKVITAPVVDNKKNKIGVMKIFYNLTREKMIDKMKSEFISIAAHQLRTPLSAIKWVIKMILDGELGKLNDEQKEFLSKGYKSNERIIELVNDMLNVSRIEEGRFGYVFNKEDFVLLVDKIVSSEENSLKSRSIKFTLNLPASLPKVYMDKTKMDLAITNLLENAIKYTPEHGKIGLTAEAGDAFIKVRIKDNGVGIPKNDLPKLFTKFFRAVNVIRMQTEGSGLGLFMVKNIIKRHGGEIVVNSEEGKGTEFIFTLPIGEAK